MDKIWDNIQMSSWNYHLSQAIILRTSLQRPLQSIFVSRKEMISTFSSKVKFILWKTLGGTHVLQEQSSDIFVPFYFVCRWFSRWMHEVRVGGRINHIPEPEFRIYISMGTQQWKRHVYSRIFCSNFQRLIIVCNFHNSVDPSVWCKAPLKPKQACKPWSYTS